MATRKFPIGIQTFEKIRTGNYLYVDKTDLVYNLVQNCKACFFNRPRRFGKSLLVTTLKSYFEGRKDLFEGLAIDKLENEWIKYPVLHFDMSTAKYLSSTQLEQELSLKLDAYERLYGKDTGEVNNNQRLDGLIKRAHEQTKQKVVILIDEYDAPLLDTLVDNDSFATMRNILRDFYSPLKACDAHLKFVFLTGITKFSQLSIFSELNNLNNISLDEEYATICGISEEELKLNFKPDIERLAEKHKLTFENALESLKKKYDGYHFSPYSPDIYNPFSLINALSKANLNNYWFNTGTPTILTQLVNKYQMNPAMFGNGFEATVDSFDTPTETAESPIPMLYQSGYLTIKGYKEGAVRPYLLKYPNSEVSDGFNNLLLKRFASVNEDKRSELADNLVTAFKNNDIDFAMKSMRAFISSIPYDLCNQNENFYRALFYLIIRSTTPFLIRAEERSAAGRSDIVIETDDCIYVFEFKLDGSAEDALKQIDEKGYMLPYEVTKKADGSPKTLYKIGANFDIKTRTLEKWIVV